MKTRVPTISMSQISPLLILGRSVRAVSGTIAVWLGTGRRGPVGAAVVVDRARGRVGSVPSLTVSVTVRVAAVA